MAIHSMSGSRWQRSLILIYWGISAPIFAALYIMLPVSPGNAIFDYMAWMRVNGAHYYADVAEINWPGIVFIHELGVRLFGVHFWTYRLTDFIILQGGCLGLFLFLKRCGFSFAPYVILVLYPPLYITTGIWMAGQRDVVAVQLLFLVSGLLLVEPSRTAFGKLQLLAAGMIMAIAVLIRPTYLTFFPLAIVLTFVLRRHAENLTKIIALFNLGFFSSLITVLFWSISSQNLDDWYDQAVLFNLNVYFVRAPFSDMLNTLVHWTIYSWHWPSLFAALGFTLWTRSRGLLSETLFVVAITCTILLSYFVQRKLFIYHFMGLITASTILMAVLIDELMQRSSGKNRSHKIAAIGMFIFVVTVAIAGTTSKLRIYLPMVKEIALGHIVPVDDRTEQIKSDEVRLVAEYIRANSNPNEYIFQWGQAFHVGFLAQRQSSSRYINTNTLNLIPVNSTHFQSWLDELSTDLAEKRPKFVVLTSDLVTTRNGQLQPTHSPSEAFQSVLDFLSSGYREVYQGKSLILMQSE